MNVVRRIAAPGVALVALATGLGATVQAAPIKKTHTLRNSIVRYHGMRTPRVTSQVRRHVAANKKA